jgi:hypothetical protein
MFWKVFHEAAYGSPFLLPMKILKTHAALAIATTGVVSKALTECYDGTSRYPSY